MKDKILWIILVIVLIGAGVGVFTMAGCRTFEPIWIDELPPICNMNLNTYRMHYNSKDKSGAVPSSIFCFKKLHRLDCREQHYGIDENGKVKVVDYENFDRYKAYNSCLNELK